MNLYFRVISYLLISSQVYGYDDFEDYTCEESICLPKEYDPLKAPKNVKVYFSFFTDEDVLKSVDDYRMTITFEPSILMVWKDPKVKPAPNLAFMTYLPLSDYIWNRIWHPKITCNHRTQKDTGPEDLGKIGNFN